MEIIKIIVLFSISITCSLSQRPEESEAVSEHEVDLKINRLEKSKGNCNGKYCRRNMEQVNSEQQCICFPLNTDNTLVSQYITNDEQGQLTRTVIYIYTIGNKSSIYIPNLLKQSLYTDLTFDDGDVLRPLSSHNVNQLTAQEYGLYPQFPKGENEDHTRRATDLENENKKQPIIIQNLEKLDLPSISDDINKEALKHVLEGDLNVLVPNKLPDSEQDFGQNGATNPQNIGEPKSVFVFDPDENEYAEHVEKPKPIMVSKPDDKDIHDTFGSQKDFDIYPNVKKIYFHHIDREPTVFESDENGNGLNPNGNEIYSQQVNKQKNLVLQPYDIAGSNFGNIGLKPNEKEIDFPLKGFGLNHDDNQLYAKPQDAFELKPITQDKQIDNIDRHVVVSGLNPNKNDLNFDRPIKELESKPSEEDINSSDSNRRDLNFGLNYNKDYFPLHHNAEPQTILESNSNENNILVDDIAKPQAIFGVSPNRYLQPIVEPQKSFGSLLNNIPKPLKDFGSTANERDFYLNNFAQPQRKVASEIDKDDLTSASLFKPQPNVRCSSGICKLYIYCSKYDCPKYLQSLAKLHTRIHKHPHLENTFIAINNARTNANNTDSHLKPFLNFIGFEDADEAVQNIRSIQLGEQNPSPNHYGHLLSQQVPRLIPIRFNPLSSISDQAQIIQNLLPPSQIQEPQVEYYPRKKQLLSTQYRNSPYYRDLFIPRPINDQSYRRTGALTPESKHNFLKDLLRFPSQIHHKGIKAINNPVSNLSLRKNNPGDEEDVSEGIEVPVEEDDIKIKIIGGQPAVSSGTPMQIKARLGDVV